MDPDDQPFPPIRSRMNIEPNIPIHRPNRNRMALMEHETQQQREQSLSTERGCPMSTSQDDEVSFSPPRYRMCIEPSFPMHPPNRNSNAMEHKGSTPMVQSSSTECLPWEVTDNDLVINTDHHQFAKAPQSLPNTDLNREVPQIITENFNRINISDTQFKPKCSIYEVPPDIRQYDEEAYKPKVVSIGPYHSPFFSHSDSNCAYNDMHDCKWHCFIKFISRHENTTAEDMMSRCKEKMMSHKERIFSYYYKDGISKRNEEELARNEEELAMIMVLDGCFILQVLLDPDHFQELPHNQVAGRLWIWTLVRYDLLLVENQIPFFVLYELLDILGVGDEKNADLVSGALRFLRHAHLPRTKNFSPPKRDEILHLLHLFYMSLLPDQNPCAPKPPPASAEAPVWIPCAKELKEFGVKFHKNKKANSFLDVNFSKMGIMEIPPLMIDDHCKNLFRNLIAFEQCHPYTGCHITVYASFMDCIINTEEDVRVLHLKGILVNRMSADQDITHFFSHLCKGIHFAKDRFYLSNLFADVTGYKDNKFNKCFGEFKRKYCSTTWAKVAVAVSVLIFIFAFAQSFFTIFPYYHPRG